MNAPAATAAAHRIVSDATCAGCGCACDDIELQVRESRIVGAERACALGQAWFTREESPGPACLVAGQPAGVADAIQRAAQLLRGARYPLVYGLDETSCEAARLVVGIADWIGGVVDVPGRSGAGSDSFHAGGEASCSLGEIANRADLVIVWRADPVVTHPRHFSRYSLEPHGRFVPGGRADRICIVVGEQPNESAALADQFIALPQTADFEALWILRALVRGVELDAADVSATTGVALAEWQALADRLKQARLAVFLFDAGLHAARAGYVSADALWALIRDLNAHTRAVAAPLAAGGNSAGAANVLCWRTGASSAVDLARGYPRFGPGEYSAEQILSRREADAALIVATDPARWLSAAALKHLATIPRVVIGPDATLRDPAATVTVRTARAGVAAPGTIFRTDGVPLPLRPALKSDHPADVEILALLEQRIRQLPAAK